MHIEDLEIWSKDPPAPWVRDAADRWARLLVRAALIYLGHFSASPISRTETEILFLLFVVRYAAFCKNTYRHRCKHPSGKLRRDKKCRNKTINLIA